MDHSWRPRLPIQGNSICPTCSISHFPFCPPRPSFNENPRFHPHNDYYMQRPPFDPFIDHYRAPTPNLHRPFVGDPSDGLPNSRAWHRSPSLDRTPYGQSQLGGYDFTDGSGDHSYDVHGGVGVKRMRIDDRGSSLVMGNENYANSSRNVPCNDRILKLIHDHGNAPGGLPQGGANLLPETNYETNRYGHGKSEEVRGVRDDYFDKSRGYFHGDHGLNLHNREELALPYGLNSITHESREERGVEYGQNSTMSNRNDRFVESRYDPIGDSMPHSLHGGNNSYSAGRFTSRDQAKQREDAVARHQEGSIPYDPISQKIESKQRSPTNAHYATSEYPNDNYQSIQRLPRSETVSVKEQHHSHLANSQLPSEYTLQHQMPPKSDFHSQIPTELRQPIHIPPQGDRQGSIGHQNTSPYGWPNSNGEHRHPNTPTTTNLIPRQGSHIYSVQPPLPTSPPPPPPLPMEPNHHYSERLASARPPPPPLKTPSSLFPIAANSRNNVPASHTPVPKAHSLEQTYYANKPSPQASTGFPTKDFQAHQSSRNFGEGQPCRIRHLLLEKLQVVDASQIFKQPHRATRPDRIVIILRGLPGSGKSYLAKMLRDLEVENGGNAPRVHSMDEYFMTEVEKVEETEVSKSSGSGKGKRTVTKKVMEYCYEPEMEEAYRSSMLKAFKKTLDEGGFSFIIVDDRNLRVADFAQFWATAKRSGYEVYLLEAAYKDPAGCAARNVHGFSLDDIQKMAGQWEEAPSLYLKLDIKPLLHGDDFEESEIQEVDMDMEDEDPVNGLQGSEVGDPGNAVLHPVSNLTSQSPSKDEKKWYNEGNHLGEVKELGSSKWSDVLDEDDDAHGTEDRNASSSALSGLIQAYSKEGKSVRWGDQGGNIGFSIGAAKRANVLSLVIGPGSGYNLKSNPLAAEEKLMSSRDAVKSRSQNVFRERMRAEHESFKAVFDKRRQRIGGFGTEED